MKKINNISAFFLTVSSLACVFWMGSYLARLMLSYQLFNETITSHKEYLNEQNLNAVLTTINPAVITTFVLYIVFFLFYFLFLVHIESEFTKKRLAFYHYSAYSNYSSL